jgi:beta-RFAP synthase
MSERVKCIVEMLQQHPDAPAVVNPWEIKIYKAAPLHQGWGTGTQLSLAVARAWCHLAGFSKWNAQEAAAWVGRGLRSGIGVAGFDQGGFLIDLGKKPGDSSRSQVQHIDLPKNWTWLLVEPKSEIGVHGEAERLALAKIAKPDIGIVKELMHLGQNVLPQAARDRSFTTFAETLTHYNRLAGSFYREIQGGDYSSREIEKRIVLLRANGAVGVGQSSWGPGVFALFPDARSAHAVRVKKLFPNCRIHQDPTSRGHGELIL